MTFSTYNIGLVASAACYVFLAGQKRFSSARGAFLFHEAGMQANGVLTGQALQEGFKQVQEHERVFLNMLKTRTKLTDGEASSFVRRTVILSAAEARRDGIVDGTAEFVVPGAATTARIVSRPNPGAVARPAAQPG